MPLQKKRDLRAACPSALEHLPYEFQADFFGARKKAAWVWAPPDFFVVFVPRFFGNDMREANPTMVLTALQSESQAQRAAFWGEVPNANVLDLPWTHPKEEYEAFLGSGILT